MPTFQQYAKLSNDVHNGADDFLVFYFTLEDIPTRVGDDASSLQAWEAMTLHLAVNPAYSVTANITCTSYLLGCDSLQSSASKDTCMVVAHAGFDTTANSQAKGQLLLNGRQLNDHGIEPGGLRATMFISPSKVAKIKADASVSPMSGLGMQVAPAILMSERHHLYRSTAANDTYGRIAA